jgi:hypothetical protein
MLRALVCSLVILAAGAGQASAAALRYFTFEAASAAARHRSADITVVVKPGMLSSRVLKLYRKRGADLDLKKPDGSFSLRQLAGAVGESEQDLLDMKLYAVDPKDGEGFAHGACDGADRAWIAINPVKAYQDLRIYVLKYDAAAKAPAICEVLDYRWRGEFRPPVKKSKFRDEVGAAGGIRR